MAEVTIYTRFMCGYCSAAKRLLKAKGVEFEEIDVIMNRGARATMLARSNGAATVPQIFIDGAHIGGCDELYALEDSSELDALLQDKPGSA